MVRSKAIKSSVPERKSVEIERASGGYIVSSYNDKTYKQTKYVTKTKAEAKVRASKLLG